MLEIGAVHRQRAHPCAHRQRRPGAQAVVGVHHVEALAPITAAQIPGGAQELALAGRELVELHVHSGYRAQRVDLVAHEPAPLRTAPVSLHVRDDERAHGPASR